MTHQLESNPFDLMIQALDKHGFDGLAHALEILFNEAMKIERSAVLGAQPYERTDDRRGYANGFKPKTLATRVGKLELEIPQTRGVEFYPQSLERGVRSERVLKLAVAEMYVQGVSTRKVTEITSELCGLEVSSSQVSRAAQLLDDELESWRSRPLGKLPYLLWDARYEKVRHGGSVVDCAVLVAVGVLPNGKRTVLGVSVSLSEAEVHWRAFLASLVERGLYGLEMITSDAHEGLKAERLLRLMLDKYRPTAPRLAEWLEQSVPEGLTVFTRPAAHRRRLRTTNLIERLNKEIQRRTRVATLFPNEVSLLRLVSGDIVNCCGWVLIRRRLLGV